MIFNFPGQGTALVGLIDAFWDSKDILPAAEFRQFSAPVVPLLQFAKAVYTNNETFEASIDVSNYGQEVLKNQGISWFLKDGGKIIEQGHFQSTIGKGHQGHVGHLEVPLQAIGQAKKLTIQLKLEGTSYENHCNIWVYP
ncbi:hypothetical protein [Sphingobacterium multivorum]|uniref:hypothetical protein n=1 Tax=Sphingobacterium multivorum TaxID=28454 RepID=UPI002899F1DD|nr:hypothetical protein [Sphingobacterium multivorum]